MTSGVDSTWVLHGYDLRILHQQGFEKTSDTLRSQNLWLFMVFAVLSVTVSTFCSWSTTYVHLNIFTSGHRTVRKHRRSWVVLSTIYCTFFFLIRMAIAWISIVFLSPWNHLSFIVRFWEVVSHSARVSVGAWKRGLEANQIPTKIWTPKKPWHFWSCDIHGVVPCSPYISINGWSFLNPEWKALFSLRHICWTWLTSCWSALLGIHCLGPLGA